MTKIQTFVLMLGLLLTASFSHASDISTTKNANGVPITIHKSADHSGLDKSSSISVEINGHYLAVSFLENLGNVSIEIENILGIVIEYNFMETPSGYLYYIPLEGRYTISFILDNGDKYYGEFEITE